MNPLRPRVSPLALPMLGRFVLLGNAAATKTTTTTTTTTLTTATAALALGGVRHKHYRPAPKEVRKFPKKLRSTPPDGHGERFWVFNHIDSDLVVYSMESEMRRNRAYAQFAYTGKKLVPAKLRKDYWRQMAMVELGPGRGDVGRSVYQKLRELMKRHQLEWEDEALLNMSRRERGKALNDQRGNVVADIAAVLAGRGKGNKMLVVADAPAAAEGEAAKKKVDKNKDGPKEELYDATVYWANEQDKYYAASWSDNVTHVIGLPEKPKKVKEVVVETEAAAAEAVEEAPKADVAAQ